MASVCELCGKRPSFGMNLSHSHQRTKRRWNPNIQNVRTTVNGTNKRINVCTSCIRAGKVIKPTQTKPTAITNQPKLPIKLVKPTLPGLADH